MERASAAIVLLGSFCGLSLAQDASDAVTEADIVPGTRVAMKKPEGLEPAERFAGFINEETATSIMISEIPASVDELDEGFSGPAARARGMTLLSSAKVTLPDGAGTLFHFKQEAQGILFLKWLLLRGNKDRSVMITATFREELKDSVSEKLRNAVLGTRWFAETLSDPRAGLPFALEEHEALRVARRMGNMLIFTKSRTVPAAAGEPRFFAGLSIGGAVPNEGRESFVKSRAKQTATLKEIEIGPVREVTIDGLPGFELEASAKDAGTGAPTILYQVMLFDDNGYVLMQGMVATSQAGEYPKVFRAMARSFRRTSAGAADRAVARRTEAAWTPLDSGIDEMIVGGQFLDAQTGFLVGGNRETETPAVLLATRNAGKSWRRIETGLQARLYDVHFPTDRVGYAVGYGGAALKTIDGGESFTRLATAPLGWLASVWFLSADVGFVAGGEKNDTGLWGTRDGGRTWSSLRGLLPESARSGSLREIVFLDEKTGYAVGHPGLILRTRDGGESWQTLPSGTDLWLRAVTFVDARVGFIGGSGGVLLRTSDGGDLWTRVSGHPDEKIMDLHFLDEHHGFSATVTGRLLETNDGGRSWNELRKIADALNVLAFAPGSDVGYAAGVKGVVLKRTRR